MERLCSLNVRTEGPEGADRFVCRCLGVTENQLVRAIVTLGLRTLKEVRTHTGAGDGCTCCHGDILSLLEQHAYAPSSSSALPICSVK